MVSMSSFPFNCVSASRREFAYIKEAFSRMHISGDGIFSQRCQAFLRTRTKYQKGAAHHLLHPCSLELAALLLDLKPGDEVIVPAFTFVSTVNAFALRRCRPDFSPISGQIR